MDKAQFDAMVRERAASDDKVAREKSAEMDYMLRPHGFIFPANMPPCAVCGDGANGGSHVNPPRTALTPLNATAWGIIRRQDAADMQKMRSPRRTHVYTTGYAGWLSNIPCQGCGQKMGASCHTPGMPCGPGGSDTAGIDARPQLAAEDGDPSAGKIVMVKHKFEAMEGQDSIGNDYKMCSQCGFPEDDSVHGVDADDAEPQVVVKQLAAAQPKDQSFEEYIRDLAGRAQDFARQAANARSQEGDRQRAFVTQVNGKLIITGPARTFAEPDESMPRELAAQWERASAANPHFMWLEGKYVEANRPNRNMAMWNGEDLELGEPTIAHGPLNMLHAERHIVGTIAAAKLVVPDRTPRQGADPVRQAAGFEDEPNHIRALSAVWRYLFPYEARQIARASDDRKLWYSMECVSQQVACLATDCSHTQTYADYMTRPFTRCQHVKEGGARRFADPHFLGGGIIIPPIRPGWAGANATVMRQAAMLAERQAAAFEGSGLSTSEAEQMVAQIIRFSEGDAAA